MKNTEKKGKKEHICVGLLAHVDAGKTTLAESILYVSGKTRTLGRVDHGNAYLDTFELERARGITIFAKQAEVDLKEKEVTFLDTPGHVDFNYEVSRSLAACDGAILVVDAAQGIEAQTLAGAGLCDSCHWRCRWRTGTCADIVASFKEI